MNREGLDRPFLVTVVLLLVSGVVLVYSACQGEDPGLGSNLWQKQIIFAFLGLFALAIAASIPHIVWDRLSPVLYVLAIGSLVAVLIVGSSAGGATRWMTIAGVRFQPSEFAKIATVLFLARTLAARRRSPDRLLSLVRPLVIVAIPMLLVARQPDLGTALVFLVFVPPMLFWSGTSVTYLLLVASPVVSILCALSLPSWIVFTVFLLGMAYYSKAALGEKILFVSASIAAGIVTPVLKGRLEPYQMQRIVAFLDPESYSSGAGYQIIQSKVAVGSGGLAGVGFLEGTQKGLAFLPARHTDFIFSVVGEEFGFLGTMTVLALFAFLIVRGLRIAATARDPFAGLTVVGVMSMIAFQAFVNIGVALGLVPVTGLPLPIYSYGGTSLVATLVSLGIVLGVSIRRRT